MTRTQILLEPWHHKFLAELARKKGTSVSAVIRHWIEEKAAPTSGSRRLDPLFEVVGMVKDSATDVSDDPDAYLYGRKSRPKR